MFDLPHNSPNGTSVKDRIGCSNSSQVALNPNLIGVHQVEDFQNDDGFNLSNVNRT